MDSTAKPDPLPFSSQLVAQAESDHRGRVSSSKILVNCIRFRGAFIRGIGVVGLGVPFKGMSARNIKISYGYTGIPRGFRGSNNKMYPFLGFRGLGIADKLACPQSPYTQ